jgi:hypothetical protein
MTEPEIFLFFARGAGPVSKGSISVAIPDWDRSR